jgi:signal transduction histidine kinase/ActR/RegA family two-component response regulator
MNRFRNLPIRQKFTVIVLLTCSILMVLSAGFFIADKFYSFRHSMVSNITALAEVIGQNCTAALTFQDNRTAEEILLALSAEPNVEAACIFQPDGTIFAAYPFGTAKETLSKSLATERQMAAIEKDFAPHWTGHRFSKKYLDLARPITLNKKTIGHIVIHVNLHRLYSRLAWSGFMVIGLMCLLVLLTQIIAAQLHRSISDPLLALVNTMEAVTKQKNYALRAEKRSNDELGILIDGFNDMLSRVQERDRQLDEHRQHLEDQVSKRTLELKQSNDQLKWEIKERKEVQERLDRAQRMEAVGTLAAGVAHDLNNILSGLVSYPDLLLMRLPVDSDMRQPLNTIRTSGQKAAAIVQDLLTLARRGITTAEVVDLRAIIEDYLVSPEHCKMISYHPDVRIETRFDPDLMNIAGSPVHLSKALMNLISNAAEAISGKGVISLSLRNQYIDIPIHGYDRVQPGDYIRMTVSDTGHGIAPKDLQRIFEPFYTKKKLGRSGTGLGMAVVWGTVKDHHGYIDVQSREGAGTRFDLYFPVTRREHKPEMQFRVADHRGAGQAILVVDDIKEQREIASGILRDLGYRVHTADSGEGAVAFLNNHCVDLLLLDMIMEPGMDGLDTYRQVLRRYPRQRAVIASGYSENDRVREAQRLGAGIYVRKPYTIENLAQAIDHEFKRDTRLTGAA